MQKAEKKAIIPSHQCAHRLDRLARPYIYFLYIFAVIPALIMIFLMFVDTEGLSFDGMNGSITNFQILTEKSTIIAFFNSLKNGQDEKASAKEHFISMTEKDKAYRKRGNSK